ncbi:uncharacterized protein BP01DRAFT_173795, partial [Aspergillus saccharolyticus JOP 1030-1]
VTFASPKAVVTVSSRRIRPGNDGLHPSRETSHLRRSTLGSTNNLVPTKATSPKPKYYSRNRSSEKPIKLPEIPVGPPPSLQHLSSSALPSKPIPIAISLPPSKEKRKKIYYNAHLQPSPNRLSPRGRHRPRRHPIQQHHHRERASGGRDRTPRHRAGQHRARHRPDRHSSLNHGTTNTTCQYPPQHRRHRKYHPSHHPHRHPAFPYTRQLQHPQHRDEQRPRHPPDDCRAAARFIPSSHP